MEDAPSLAKIQSQNVSYLDTSTETQMAQIMVQYGRSSRFSGTKSVWSSFGGTIMGKEFEKVKKTVGKSSTLGMLIR